MIYILTIIGAVLVVAIVVIALCLLKLQQQVRTPVVQTDSPVRLDSGVSIEAPVDRAKCDRVGYVDDELQRLALRGSLGELLRTARLFRAMLNSQVSDSVRRQITKSVEMELVAHYAQGIDEALQGYDENPLQSLLTGTRRLYDMVLMSMSLNLRSRKGRDNLEAHHLTQELRDRVSLPWGMIEARPDCIVEIPGLVSESCEQLNAVRSWVQFGAEVNTESAFAVLLQAGKKLAQLERHLKPAGL